MLGVAEMFFFHLSTAPLTNLFSYIRLYMHWPKYYLFQVFTSRFLVANLSPIYDFV